MLTARNKERAAARREIRRGYDETAAVACKECRTDYKESAAGQCTAHLRHALGRKVLAEGTCIFPGQRKANGSDLPRLSAAPRR